MARTTLLRAQIDAAEAMIDRILIKIDDYRGDASAYPLSLDLARLAGVVRIQFTLGERHLYPFMIASAERGTIEIARGFRRENCTLVKRFDDFVEQWTTSKAIAGDVANFRSEAEAMFVALRERFQREIRDLYPLAEAVADGVTMPAPHTAHASAVR